jgi:hypothetical protein
MAEQPIGNRGVLLKDSQVMILPRACGTRLPWYVHDSSWSPRFRQPMHDRRNLELNSLHGPHANSVPGPIMPPKHAPDSRSDHRGFAEVPQSAQLPTNDTYIL